MEGKRGEDDGEQEGRRSPEGCGEEKAAVKAGGGGGLGRSRMGTVRGSGMSHEDDNNSGVLRDGCRRWKLWEAAYYQGLLVLKTSNPPPKKIFSRLFLWANMVLCLSCGS